MTPQRPYKAVAQNAARKLHLRHENGRMDCTITRDKMQRPYGATPRTAKDWR